MRFGHRAKILVPGTVAGLAALVAVMLVGMGEKHIEPAIPGHVQPATPSERASQTPTPMPESRAGSDSDVQSPAQTADSAAATMPGPTAPRSMAGHKMAGELPEDFGRHVTLMLNGSGLSNPRKEPAVVPYITMDGRSVIPARWILEAIGATVDWDPAMQMVHASWKGRSVMMTIGETAATIDGKKVVLEEPPRLVAGRTIVPLRQIMEALGARVDWDDFNHLVLITLEGAQCQPEFC